MKSYQDFVNEGLSKINPGKKIIAASLAGSGSAAKYVQSAQAALKKLQKIDEEIKKAKEKKDKENIKKCIRVLDCNRVDITNILHKRIQTCDCKLPFYGPYCDMESWDNKYYALGYTTSKSNIK